jgi:hypothetical protein
VDNLDFNRAEIDRVLQGTPEHHTLSMKVSGDSVASRWMAISPKQARAIRELLATGDLDRIRVALDGGTF